MKRACLVPIALALLAPLFSKSKDNPLDRYVPVPETEPIPVVDFFRPHQFSNPKLNPAGTHFAASCSTGEDKINLVIVELATKKTEFLTTEARNDIASYEWLGDRRLVFSIIKDKLFSYGLFAAELGKLGNSYTIQRHNVVVPIGFPKASPFQALIWLKHSAQHVGADRGVLKIDIRKSMKDESVGIYMDGDDGLRADILRTYPAPQGGEPVSYIADKDDELAFAITIKNGIRHLHYYVDDKWQQCPVNLEQIDFVSAGDRHDEFLVRGPRQEGKPRGLYRMNAVDGKLGELLYQDDEYDFQSVRFYRHPVDDHIIGVQYHRNGPISVWFEESYVSLQSKLENALPGEVVRILGSDKEQKQFFVRASSDVTPGVYYHILPENGSAQPVANTAPWIDPKRMRPMKMFNYKTRDDRKIEAYVTLPANASKENPVPLVVLPHGGARNTWGWNPEVQFLASRGYAVFQPNYRGSTGTIWRFPKEDTWAFRKMHEDVTDGVNKLLKTGMIDRDRMAIMGASFGGYLALCGAVYEPSLYRCAITMAGVFDWEQVIKESRNDEYHRGSYELLKRRLGDPAKQKEKFDEISPLRSVSQIKIPIFVAHGGEDFVASEAGSKKLIAELKKYNVPFEKHMEREEGHGFHKLKNKIEFYSEVEAFLAKNLAPRAKP